MNVFEIKRYGNDIEKREHTRIEFSESELRDYFAGQAIGLLVLDSTNIRSLQENKGYPMHELVADFCYNLADAMLKRREKK